MIAWLCCTALYACMAEMICTKSGNKNYFYRKHILIQSSGCLYNKINIPLNLVVHGWYFVLIICYIFHDGRALCERLYVCSNCVDFLSKSIRPTFSLCSWGILTILKSMFWPTTGGCYIGSGEVHKLQLIVNWNIKIMFLKICNKLTYVSNMFRFDPYPLWHITGTTWQILPERKRSNTD